MKIDGRDFLTCAEKKCDVKYCEHRSGFSFDELGGIVWLPGLDCPKKNTEEKPSLGPKPYYICIDERIRELAAAIDENASRSHKHVKAWAFEIALLKDVEKALNKAMKQKGGEKSE